MTYIKNNLQIFFVLLKYNFFILLTKSKIVLSDDRIFIPHKVGVLKILSLKLSKTRVINCSRKTNTLFFHCNFEHRLISHTVRNDLGVLFDSKLYFHYHVDHIYFCFCLWNLRFSLLILLTHFRLSSWSSDQSLWLLIMRSRNRFPALPWEFSLKGKISAVTVVWVD